MSSKNNFDQVTCEGASGRWHSRFLAAPNLMDLKTHQSIFAHLLLFSSPKSRPYPPYINDTFRNRIWRPSRLSPRTRSGIASEAACLVKEAHKRNFSHGVTSYKCSHALFSSWNYIGNAVGDAYGLATEFMSKKSAKERYGNGPIHFGTETQG